MTLVTVLVLCMETQYYCVFQGGLSALMLCCEEGNLEMTKLLLDSHANPDLQQSVSIGHS